MKNIISGILRSKKIFLALAFIFGIFGMAYVFQISLFDLSKATLVVSAGYLIIIGRGRNHRVDFQRK